VARNDFGREVQSAADARAVFSVPKWGISEVERLKGELLPSGAALPEPSRPALILNGLYSSGLASEEAVLSAVCRICGMKPAEDVPSAEILAASVSRVAQRFELTSRWFVSHGLLVWEGPGEALLWAAVDPFDVQLEDSLRLLASRGVQARLQWVLPSRIQRTLELLDAEPASTEGASALQLAQTSSTVQALNAILARAVELGASDIHIEPIPRRGAKVRFRVDGSLSEAGEYPLALALGMVSRIKLLSGLNIAERRRPQDGTFRPEVSGRIHELRVSAVPAHEGESIVLRIPVQADSDLGIDDLGYDEATVGLLRNWSRRGRGVVLVTGPTGSGKTTTLYAVLKAINTGARKIITVEDPVERDLPGVTQLQVNERAGFTFANALRSILRHDPDVIMVGEIRDSETARICVQAALTGHLVLATLHTNDALGAITRLHDLGVESYLYADSLAGLMAQRLVRKLCKVCGGRGINCNECGGSGYRGRAVLYETVDVDEHLRDRLHAHVTHSELARIVFSAERPDMQARARSLVEAGVTDEGEIIRAC